MLATTTPYGRLSMNISAVMAQFEREIISERIKDNVYLNAQNGNYTGGTAPIGYKTKRIEYTNARGQVKKKTILVADPETQEIVKDIFYKYIEYKSMSKVINYLDSKGIKTKNNTNFDSSSLGAILSNLTYAVADKTLYNYLSDIGTEICNSIENFNGSKALYVHNTKNKITRSRTDIKDQMVAMGEHNGLIPSKEWIEVQEIIEDNTNKFFTNKGRLATSDVGLLSGLLKCANCGSTMRIRKHGVNSKNEPQYYYSCIKKDTTSSHECNIRNLTGYKVDNLIVNKLLELNENTDLLKIKTVSSLPTASDKNDPIKKLKKEINKYENKINNLVEQLSENTSSAKYLLAEIEKLDAKINELNLQIKQKEETTQNEKYTQYNLELISKALSDLKDLNNIENINTKRTILKTIIKEIKWDGVTLQVYFNNAETINFWFNSKGGDTDIFLTFGCATSVKTFLNYNKFNPLLS